MTSCVFLWSPPRCISTAFELSIRQLPGVKCYHEPFMAPYYIGPDRLNTLYSHVPVDITKTYDAALQEIQKSLQLKEHKAVFVKGMSAFMEGHEDVFLQEDIKTAKHTFLIRNPVQSGLSSYKLCIKKHLNFDPKSIGLESTYKIYQFVKENLGDTNPVVVDAESLLLDPDRMLESYCEATGLKYEMNMGTKWSSKFTLESMGADPMFCAGSHDTALDCSGIDRARILKPIPDEELPEIVRKTSKEQMQYYEALKSISLKL